MKLDRQLIQVTFVTWLPGEVRLTSREQIDPKAKAKMFVRLWSPFPLDENGHPAPDLLQPYEQGALWAQNECIRMRPDGREVLAIDSVEMTGILESTIANQPKSTGDDFGLSKSILV